MSEVSMFVASKNHLSADLQGEAVILEMASGQYFGLNQVGTRVWELVQQPISVSSIQQIILDEYDVTPERCEMDVTTLLDKLLKEGLIEEVNGA